MERKGGNGSGGEGEGGKGRKGKGEEGMRRERSRLKIKCRRIHSFSLFFSVIKSSQEAR